jgi:hypothetical protein
MKIKNIKEKIIIFIMLLVATGMYRVLKIPCIVLHITGIECLGCGMTRALLSALRFDFVSAFEYHRMFWSLPIIGLYVLFDGKLFKNRVLNYAVIILIGAGFILNWAMNLFG